PTEALDSGALIRMVVHGDRGALIHDLKVAGQSFFAATLNGKRAAVDQVDRCVSQVADEAARRIGAPSLLWGGYRKRGESGDQWFHHGDGGLPPAEYPVSPGREAGSRSVPEPSADLGRKALDLADLHFVGLYHDDRLVWRADLFDAPVLGPFFQRVTPESRRQGYNQVIQQVSMDAHRIRQLLDLTRSSRLDRLVIDVARGAIYVLPLEDREYSLVGVTLVQTQVDEADQKLTALRDTLAGAFGPGALRVRPGIARERYGSLGAGVSPPPSAISMAVA
ncbi:MAG: hypothetical protein J2P26_12180, partial [Nocardiopsaceae bacterium]|nr:hypothetical protein [Nocardiopsaceae bacterium]